MSKIDGYRPYHAVACPARTSWAGRECTCGGLERPVWNPGDEPRAAEPGPVNDLTRPARVTERDGRGIVPRAGREDGQVIQRYRRKPQEDTGEGIVAAQYEPGADLGDLATVAAMTGQEADVAEAPLPGGTVLVARWRRYRDDGPSSVEYTVVAAGHWLCFSGKYDSLVDDTTEGIAQWYVPE